MNNQDKQMIIFMFSFLARLGMEILNSFPTPGVFSRSEAAGFDREFVKIIQEHFSEWIK